MNHAQGNAILDLYEQCQVVAQSWEQQETHRRSGEQAFEKTERKKVAEKIAKTYAEACDRLTYLYCHAEELEVSCELLDNLIGLMLPDCDLASALAT